VTRAGPAPRWCAWQHRADRYAYLTEGSSGLTTWWIVSRLGAWRHVTLMRGERSRLADYAGEVL